MTTDSPPLNSNELKAITIADQDIDWDDEWTTWLKRKTESTFEQALSWGRKIENNYGSIEGINGLFKISPNLDTDAIGCSALNWGFGFQEPQLTKGIAYFLNAGFERERLARIKSFVIAAGISEGFIEDVDETIVVESEYSPDGSRDRIDLLFVWKRHGNQFEKGIVVEAKLGSKLADDQIAKYDRHADKLIKDSRRVFLASSYSVADITHLSKSSSCPPWKKKLWWKFCRDWECQLKNFGCVDDADFKLFRSTLWEHVL